MTQPLRSGARGTVLALRALGLGDALTGIPALRGVRRRWSDHRLVLAAPAGVGGWLRSRGVVDDVLVTQGLEPLRWPWDGAGPSLRDAVTKGRGPEVAVNLHGRGPQSHQLLRALDPGVLIAFAEDPSPRRGGPSPGGGTPARLGDAGSGHDRGPPLWDADEHEVDRWCRLVRAAGGPCGRDDLRLDPPTARGDTVVLHPGAASGSRRWPVQRWRAVVRLLSRAGVALAVTGSASERDLCAAVSAAAPGVRDLAGDLDLDGLAAVVGGARLLVCGDTGVAHLATAFGTPSVLLFGPTPPRRWGPAIDPGRHTVLWHGEDGGPPGDPHADEVDTRLLSIGVEEVLAAVDAQLRTDVPPPLAS